MGRCLVFAETAELAGELLTKARELGLEVDAAVLGSGPASAAGERLRFGAERVYVSEAPPLATFAPDIYAQALTAIVTESGADTVLLASTRRGKELAGRLAQRLNCGAVTDAIDLAIQEGGLVARRYALGGNTVATERIESSRRVLACVPHSFESRPTESQGTVVPLTLTLPAPRLTVVGQSAKQAASVDVTAAERLVVVGKGLARHEDLTMIEELASLLGAEIGCTRALAADYHWLTEDRVIGISGKITRPRLLVSIGASGQIQHTVGILGARTIVAINKDKAAPIFRMSDYGIVGDLYQVVPKLIERLRSRSI